MKISTLIIACVAFVASAIAGPILTERETLYCGTQPYDPNDYTCYADDGNLLCPIDNGVIYQPCGPACFNPANYGCTNGELYPVGNCNGQVYDHNSYVCVNGHLCPVGYPNLCGTACYSLSQYRCVNGQLVQQ